MDRTGHPTFSVKGFHGTQRRTIPIEKLTGELFELDGQIAMTVQVVTAQQPISCKAGDGRWSVAMCHADRQSVESGIPVSFENQ